MTLSLIVAGRSTGTFGTFEVTDGNVSKNRKLILQFFNDTTALVPMDARSAFTTGEEHSAFDATLMALSTVGVSIQYVESIAKFMDPKARFAEWLKGDLTPASVGLSLSQEELAVPSAYESARQKFIALFTPALPVFSSGGIDTVAIFGADDAAEIEKWRRNERDDLPQSVLVKSSGNQAARGLLRIMPRGSGHIVQNERGHHVSRTRFFAAYRSSIKGYWEGGASTSPRGDGRLTRFYIESNENGGSYSTNQNANLYKDHIEVGCQSIPRAEVERAFDELTALGYTR